MPYRIDGKLMDPYCPKCDKKIVAYCGPRKMACDWCGWKGHKISIKWKPITPDNPMHPDMMKSRHLMRLGLRRTN